jgi:hypothetical protein
MSAWPRFCRLVRSRRFWERATIPAMVRQGLAARTHEQHERELGQQFSSCRWHFLLHTAYLWGHLALARRIEGFLAKSHPRDQWVLAALNDHHDPIATPQCSQLCLEVAIFCQQDLSALLHLHDRYRDLLESS